ncbi:MAG: hypothetical protein KAR19_08250 [Bacteroidales bacterium]|nr:hypothetical protein [Bacteroidales bacterium]
MIYLFRIISDEDQEFFRDLVIDGSDTFLDFHHILQENLGYDPSQLASFFITNEMWEKQQEITLIDMMADSVAETAIMDQASIQDHISEVTQRMIYVFDFFSERAFFMELIEKSDQTSDRETPFIGHSKGEAPPQLALDLLMDEPEETLDEFDPEEEQDHLRLDELDHDMFDTEIPEDF